MELARGKSALLITRNNEQVISFDVTKYNDLKRIRPHADETSAMLTFESKANRKMEFNPGSAYLSQGSKSIVLTPGLARIDLFDSKGKLTRSIIADEKVSQVKAVASQK